VGLAFQLKDDLFDVYSDEITFGKQIGGDIKSNKKTYLYLLALEKANMKQKEELTYWFTTPSTDFKTKFKQVKSIFDELNINVLTEDKIRYYVEKAVYNVNQLSVKEEYKKKLIEYAQQLAQRIK